MPLIALLLIHAGGVSGVAGTEMTLGVLDGSNLQCDLVSMTSDGVVKFRENGDERQLDLDEIVRLAPAHSDSALRFPADSCVLHLADGGIVRGRMLRTQSGKRSVRVDLGNETIVEIPFESLSAVRMPSQNAELERDFAERLANRRPGRDTLLVVRAAGNLALQGSLESLSATGWTFRIGSKDRQGTLAQVFGFVLGAPVKRGEVERLTVTMVNGNAFSARIASADDSEIKLIAACMGPLSLKWRDIRMIDHRSPRMVFVSDLEPSATVVRSVVGVDWPVKKDRNVTGGPLRLAKRAFAKGLGVHAYTSLSFRLDGQFESFSALVGIDDSVAPHGSAVFRVRLDGKVAFESKTLRAGDTPVRIQVGALEAKSLTLECDPADGLDLSDHGNWAHAVLIRPGESS